MSDGGLVTASCSCVAAAAITLTGPALGPVRPVRREQRERVPAGVDLGQGEVRERRDPIEHRRRQRAAQVRARDRHVSVMLPYVGSTFPELSSAETARLNGTSAMTLAGGGVGHHQCRPPPLGDGDRVADRPDQPGTRRLDRRHAGGVAQSQVGERRHAADEQSVGDRGGGRAAQSAAAREAHAPAEVRDQVAESILGRDRHA